MKVNYIFNTKIFCITLVVLISTCFKISAQEKVLTGLDVLEKNNFSILKNKRVGIITNHTAINNKGDYILDIFSKQNTFKLKAIFTPEHGLKGKEDKEFIPSEIYGENIPVYSLYGDVKKPTKEMLKDLDILIYDIQDIGTRYYTFITTMAYAMESASENKLPFMVLDRPNPITGNIIEGEVLEDNFKSFTGYFNIPTRYGMTVGEIASYFNKEKHLNLKLDIIKMENWKRNMWFDETGLKWINPSPNIRSLDSAIVYPGFGMLETTNISVGRGTNSPFLYYGSPWLKNKEIVKDLTKMNFSGLEFKETNFTPNTSVYENKINNGFEIKIKNRNEVRSFDAMIYTTYFINKYNSKDFKVNGNDGIRRSFGSGLLLDMINNKISAENLIKKIKKNQAKFLPIREKYLLYK
ncbi:MAG: DUF1343 domain-containing protein [Cyanobacteriota bacterium]